VASLALISAIAGFDPARGTAFSASALPSSVDALQRCYSATSSPRRAPTARRLDECAVLRSAGIAARGRLFHPELGAQRLRPESWLQPSGADP
jgi:hypothetical protein